MSNQSGVLRGILTDIVNELENLRANQVLIGNHIGDGTRLMDVVDAKTKALEEIAPLYAELKKQIASFV